MSPAPEPRKGARTRERILDAALGAFSEQGFNAVSLRDIAARAGLTHVGLLHHFPSKEDLLVHVLERRDELDLAELREQTDVLDRSLLVWALRIVARNTTTPGAASLYARLSSEAADPEHPAHAHFVDRYQRLAAALAAAIGTELAERRPPFQITAEEAGRQFLALMDGLQLQWLLEPDRVDMVGSLLGYLASIGIVIDRETIDPVDTPGPGSGTGRAPAARPASSTEHAGAATPGEGA